ncbi:MAG: sensor histidine kinase KdpD [Anaerolineae bacterium]|nr:sensor histidine kinase KdpD [Anaerolineae bacterium]
MEPRRPNPDEILARILDQESKSQRGRLKIFFGAAAGVGKTYAMLEAAQARRDEGVDVVAGYVEPHRRPETEALLEGLEVLPSRMVDYRGTQLREFDLDAGLMRRPDLILVDELAHTNAPGSRHPKRWQDVEELLEAGINVYTTVNVQHLESLNDIVAQITGTIVRETIPDSIFERADEVELIDLPPEELVNRLQAGKVYVAQQAEQAVKSFFRRGNLMALRELALRRTAERVDEQMQTYRQDKAVAQVWPAGERILVCISPSPLSARLVRAAKRMATGLHADWIAAYVETSRRHLSEADRTRVIQTLRLAEQLGAETITLSGHNVAEEIVAYARRQNVSKIVVGKPIHSTWRDVIFGSVLNSLVRQSGAIDVYAISGEIEAPQPAVPEVLHTHSHWTSYLPAIVIVIACSLFASAMHAYFAASNLIMVYLVGVVIAATRYGRGPSVVASFLSVLAFDFFFVDPYLTFAVSDTEYLVTFGVMLLVALTISSMTVRIKEQAEGSRERERRTYSSYQMSREFSITNNIDHLVEIAIRHTQDIFQCHAVILLPDPADQLEIHGSEAAGSKFTLQERGVARWVYDRGQPAGRGTQTLPGSEGLYLPLATPNKVTGVLGIYPSQIRAIFSPDQLHLLEAYANLAALAIERAQLTEETEKSQVQIETERMRNSLLSSVSHDLRTPLAAITGAVSSILQHESSLDPQSAELARIAYEEAQRLNRLVGNLLDMTRLDSGNVQVEKEWQPLEEVVGTTLVRLDKLLSDHPLKTHLPDDLPLVPIDSVLIEQVLVNLLENAIKYTPPGSPIDLSAWAEGDAVVVEAADRGPGLPPGEEERIFDKFYRVRPTTTGGVGLGLTICRAIIEAHGGRLWAANRAGGGAVFRFTLPLGGEPPEVNVDEEQTR